MNEKPKMRKDEPGVIHRMMDFLLAELSFLQEIHKVSLNSQEPINLAYKKYSDFW